VTKDHNSGKNRRASILFAWGWTVCERRVTALRWHPGIPANIGTLSGQGLALALKARRASTAAWAADLLPVVRDIQGQGAMSLRRVATVLNDRGIPTRRGGQWTAVQRLLAVI
jgi:hypothetical protein